MNNIINDYNLVQTIINNTNNTNNVNNVNNINSYVEKVYVINLNTDKLRQKYISILMQKININYVLITVKSPIRQLHERVMQLSKKMTVVEAGKYLSHMWCLQDIIKNNHKNAIILEDNIIVHKDFHSLFTKIVINGKDEIDYDYLMLGATDTSINNEKSDLVKDNIYIPKYGTVTGSHAIYYSQHGAKIVFDHRLTYPVSFDYNLKEVFDFFNEEKMGIIYPNLFTIENSILSIGHKLNIFKYKYYESYKDLDYENYHFIYFDLINKACVMDTNYYKEFDVNRLIKMLLMNYYNNNNISQAYLNKLSTDFFTTEDYLHVIDIIKNRFDKLFYKYYYNYCKKLKITPGIILRSRNSYNEYNNTFWKNEFPENQELNKYPYLFHKQLLNLRENLDIIYEIIMSNTINRMSNIYVAHLHCYDIDKFEHYYGKYYIKISEKMDVIITYSIGNNIPNINCTILKINNYGYDVGAKFAFMKYLIDNNKSYKYILFLQSKSCDIKRKILYESLVNNLNYIFNILATAKKEIGGFFPPYILAGNNKVLIYDNKYIDINCLSKFLNTAYVSNNEYINDFNNYFNIDENIKYITAFPYGNIYMLHWNVANTLFTDKKIYNCLNDINSFDYNWIKQTYNIQHTSVKFIYECYKKFNLCNNNLKLREIKDSYMLSDFMVEHVFERIMFQTIAKADMGIYILPNGKNVEQIKNLSEKINACYSTSILYDDFDWESYLENNKDLVKHNINTKEKAWKHWTKYGWNEERNV